MARGKDNRLLACSAQGSRVKNRDAASDDVVLGASGLEPDIRLGANALTVKRQSRIFHRFESSQQV